MTQVTCQGNPVHTHAALPEVGSTAPSVHVTTTELDDISLTDFSGKRVVVSLFPSVDTDVCAASVRRFNAAAAELADTVVVCVSRDLPFALARFCGAEGLDNVHACSAFRSNIGTEWGVELVDGPFAGLLSRAVVILDANGKVIYTEQVPEITDEPDYEAALAALR